MNIFIKHLILILKKMMIILVLEVTKRLKQLQSLYLKKKQVLTLIQMKMICLNDLH